MEKVAAAERDKQSACVANSLLGVGLTTSRGSRGSSWRRTSNPTTPPMGVARSRDTTSSCVRPFRSTPFT